MKPGAENRKKTIALGVLGSAALIGMVYTLYSQFGGSSAPPPAPVAQTAAAPVAAKSSTTTSTSTNSNAGKQQNAAAIPGVAATRMASTSSSLDPTLDESAMLRTESLVYSGTGRNIFSLVYTPPVVAEIKAPLPPVRNTPPPPVQTGPPPIPPPPPINLKFFGTAQRGNGVRQAFLLQGEDVYLASEGDIVARKYKIKSISTNSIQVEDLTNNNTQTLPLQMN